MYDWRILKHVFDSVGSVYSLYVFACIRLSMGCKHFDQTEQVCILQFASTLTVIVSVSTDTAHLKFIKNDKEYFQGK